MYYVTSFNQSFNCTQYAASGGWTIHQDKATVFASFDEARAEMQKHPVAYITNA